MRIVETDNFGSDYPNESFLNIPRINSERAAQRVVDALNEALCYHESDFRCWKLVEDDYILQPGFEP